MALAAAVLTVVECYSASATSGGLPQYTIRYTALLEGNNTSAEKLAPSAGAGELVQFWRLLAGCVTANGVADGRRIDLLGCRVVEAPQEGAALLKVRGVALKRGGAGHTVTTKRFRART